MSRPNDGLSSKKLLATSAAVAVAASVVPGVLNALQVRAQSHALASDRAFKIAYITPNTSGNAEKGRSLLQPGGRVVAGHVSGRALVHCGDPRHGFDNRG